MAVRTARPMVWPDEAAPARDADTAAEVLVQHLTQTAVALTADPRPA
ncbi:Uncharacterised protein [Mycobacterium tuberculosis]|nr:Uncharacterised protein [Mycobacterium tuberculosis]